MAKLEDVFGVTSRPVRSYVEREDIDNRFRDALRSTKQIIVYGSSKQGKTALVSKYLPYENHILVSLTPKSQLADIYQLILSKAGVRINVGSTEKTSSESSLTFGARVKALIPVFGSGEASANGTAKDSSSEETKYEEIPLNLELPQAISDLLHRVGSKKWVILENFHYLNDDIQRQFAFDLRAYQELGIRFVILGVWREKNRMAQFNGDLLDRTIEVPVEPWHENDFRRVVAKGETELRVAFGAGLVEKTIQASFSSIGVFQELLRHICSIADIKDTCSSAMTLDDETLLARAVEVKTLDYSARHQRALEAIAAGHTTGGAKGDLPPLFLPYYLVRIILEHGFEGIGNGAHRNTLQQWISQIHHRGGDVRTSDMTNLLGGIANLQSVKSISPPIFAYDTQQRMLQVVDSTFYFFIKNADLGEIVESIPNPLEQGG